MIAGDKIKAERIKRGLSQEELGNLLGVTKVSVCGYEKGTRTPTIDTLLKLSEVLNIGPNELIGKTVFAVEEEGVPYQFSITEQELNIIKELRKHKELHEQLCKNLDSTIEQIITMIKE